MVIVPSTVMPEGEWPSDGLEILAQCPVCGSEARSLLLEGLRDTTFYTAPGGWDLWRCGDCRSGYLDPRPTAETLHLAYSSYYTHVAPAELRAQNKPLWHRVIPAGVNRIMRLCQGADDNSGYIMRYLPDGQSGSKMLLDVGCGNGAFLRLAAERGWKVFGCDLDPAAVATASSLGLAVRQGGPEAFRDYSETFDAVTLNHVIEHVSDPRKFLAQVQALMRPGGHLFIDTPNIDALGLSKFQHNWRGLEPPRHFVLFSWTSMSNLLDEVGFKEIERKPQRRVALGIWTKSERIAQGHSPYDVANRPGLRFLKHAPSLRRIPAERTEFITLVARAPQR